MNTRIEKKNITCPTCEQKGTWTPDNPCRPFCSERCKLIDLGEWAEGRALPGEPVDLNQENPEDSI